MKFFKKTNVNNVTMVLAKICEIILWCGVAIAIVMTIFTVFDFNTVANSLLEADFAKNNCLTGYGLDVTAISANGEVNMSAVIIFLIGLAFAFGLMAMVFRNIHLIMKTLMGKNKNIKSVSPFHKDIIRMTREIGTFAIAIPVVNFILSIIITAISHANGMAAEVSVNISVESIMVALVCFCLTNVFTYGASLEKDVDGLV